MIEDLTIDELRWLEASEILDFPSSVRLPQPIAGAVA